MPRKPTFPPAPAYPFRPVPAPPAVATPKYCRLKDFARDCGLFTESSLPSVRTVRRWRERGLLIEETVGTSTFVNIPQSIKRLTQSPL